MIGLVVKGIAALLAVGGIGTVVVVATGGADTTDQAAVTHIVDGDTIDVAHDGRTERIRLLNIDTPETVDPEQDVQCLGPEASAFLASLIPVGSTVTLEYDDQRIDGYGRTLAGVFAADGTLVNAAVARAGLAAVGVVDGNDRFYPEVQEAAQSARQEARGLYSPDVPCTLPAQLEGLASAVAGTPTAASQPASATAAQLDTAASEVGPVIGTADTLASLLTGDHDTPVFAAFTPADLQRFSTQVGESRVRAEREQTALRTAADGARTREAEAARKAEADAAAARAAERQRRAGADQAGTGGSGNSGSSGSAAVKPGPKPAPKPAPEPAPDPDPPAASSGNPYPGYTGPRCYDPGGVTWRPCPERG